MTPLACVTSPQIATEDLSKSALTAARLRVSLNSNLHGVEHSEQETPSTSFFCLLNRLTMADLQPDESNHSGSLKLPKTSPTLRGKRKRYTPVAWCAPDLVAVITI